MKDIFCFVFEHVAPVVLFLAWSVLCWKLGYALGFYDAAPRHDDPDEN